MNVNDLLEPGKKHRFFFQGAQTGPRQHWYVPIVVAKGAQDGKRISLTAGVHGDELSPVDAVQRMMAELDPAQMAGTVIATAQTQAAPKPAISLETTIDSSIHVTSHVTSQFTGCHQLSLNCLIRKTHSP